MPKQIYADVPMGEVIHRWNIQEFVKYDRNRAWHIFMVVAGAALVAYGMFSNNFLFSLIIILAAIILFLHSHTEPLALSFQVTELGLTVGGRFYPYDELDTFFIIYQPPEVKTIFFEPKSPLRPRLRIPLDDMNPVEVRHTLQAFLPEDTERTEEPMSDMIARRWRLL